MTERWKDVVDYEGYYKVSNRGRVRTIKTGKIRKLRTQSKGYLRVGLCMKSELIYYYVHRLVLTAFVRPPKDDEQTNHKDGVKDNNRIGNLEWVTCKENHQHKVDVLKLGVGEKHYAYGKFGKKNKGARHYIVTDPDGKEYHVHGLREFCREHGLRNGTMCGIANGLNLTHKGWKCQHD